MIEELRPTWTRLAISLGAAVLVGGAGIVLYVQVVSFRQSDNPFLHVLAYVLCWPVVLLAMTRHDFSHTFDLARVLWPFGWTVLFGYYYILVSLVAVLRRAVVRVPRNLSG